MKINVTYVTHRVQTFVVHDMLMADFVKLAFAHGGRIRRIDFL